MSYLYTALKRIKKKQTNKQTRSVQIVLNLIDNRKTSLIRFLLKEGSPIIAIQSLF